MPAADRQDPIAIVGAGIAGLTAALELSRRGYRSLVFEKAQRLEAAGAGIQLSPNALRVLSRLGLTPALEESGTSARSVTLRSGRTGRMIAEIPVLSSDETPYLSIHRSDLQRVLLDAARSSDLIALRLGHRLIEASPCVDGVRLVFETTDHARREAPASPVRYEQTVPLVIGADGVHSRLAAVLGLDPEIASGALAWRALLNEPTNGIEAWLGARSHAVAYPVEAGQRTNLVLIEPEKDGMRADRLDVARSRARRNLRLRGMIERSGSFTAWPLSTTPADRAWRHFGNRVLLVGDAAHGLLPYAAQGAGMAIEDAAVLGSCLGHQSDLPSALSRYEQERRPRIEKVRKRVAFHEFVYHLPSPFALARNGVLATRSQRSLAQDLAWLYDWHPPA